ncbi:response regulator [Vulgatibacter sp.]|uniref:response regulator n=1 Tax=Vulgatibacter sp. TaxID=1971226 RepID=UPI003563A93B
MATSILLVDADANFRRALRIALTLDGVAVGEAATLDEARAALQQQRWDCALVDLLLPCGEGASVLELLEQVSNLGVVVCSAHAELLASHVGRHVVLEKPFSPQALLGTVGRILGSAAAQPCSAVERR